MYFHTNPYSSGLLYSPSEYAWSYHIQTSPGAKHPLKLVVEGLRPSDQTSPGAKHPLKLVVEGLRPSDQTSPMTKRLKTFGLRTVGHL